MSRREWIQSVGTTSAGLVIGGLIGTHLPRLQTEELMPEPVTSSRDIAATRSLRSWARERICWGTPSTRIDESSFEEKDADEIFAMFARNEGTISCLGAAVALKKLYQTHGFESEIVVLGIPSVMTHAVTLVSIEYDGRKVLSVHDPSFDISYVTPEGEPYDYKSLIETLRRRRDDLVRVEYGLNKSYPFLVDPNDDLLPYYGLMIDSLDRPVERLRNGWFKYEGKETRQSFVARFGNAIGTSLREKGFPPKSVYLFLCSPTLSNHCGTN